MENIFKAYRRIFKHGSENKKINVERVYNIGAEAAVAAINTVHERVDADDVEEAFGRGGWEEVRRHVPFLGQDHTSLGMKAYRTPTSSSIPKSDAFVPTCAPSAHSQQIGCEEALLACSLNSDGTFESLTPLEKSWRSQLCECVAHEAKHMQDPYVLVFPETGNAYLIVLNLHRCVMGWPLRILADSTFGLCRLIKLEPLVLTDVYSWG